MKEYVSPEFEVDAFHCPHCKAYAHQTWHTFVYTDTGSKSKAKIPNLSVVFCSKCGEYALWYTDIKPADNAPLYEHKMIYPVYSIAPLATEDMPEDVKIDFMEARNIVNASPRAAAALLRLALQKLMVHLGEKGKHIDTDIKNLVAKGLPVRIQQALDIVRVIGNSAVHPAQIDIKDDTETAITLFKLLNMIVEVMITQPKEVNEMYAMLPDTKKDAIKKRDGKA